MSDYDEYTLSAGGALALAAELLTYVAAPTGRDQMYGVDYRDGQDGRKCRPVDVIAWCRERQSPAIKRALAMASKVTEIMATIEYAGEDETPDEEQAVYDALAEICQAGDDAAGDES